MGYTQEIAEIVTVYRNEIEADLVTARGVRDRALDNLSDAERHVAFVESLMALVRYVDVEPGPQEKVTLHVAMRKVLEDSRDRAMKAAEIAAEIQHRGLYRMRDGRPVEAQQIHARVGHYPDVFVRDGTLIRLKNAPSSL